ncbi:MAG: WYL domain-containing protein [Clostridia bacterium]|nr:WYL domain-containing protein [Clostridia bacterium]
MKKYLHFDLIRILKENTDRAHPMLQKDLLAELRKKDEKINRTTVWNALNDLLANSQETRIHHLGEEAEATSEKDTRQYYTNLYYDQEFTDAELRWLIDGILYSRNVPHADRDVIIGKLCELGNQHFRKNMSMKKIRRLSDDEPMNEELFRNIDIIGKAMQEGKKIGAVYNYMGPDFELYPVYDDPDYHQLLNPYAMVMRNGFYFLICNKDNYDDMTHYRIDRMTDIIIEEKPIKPVRDLKDFHDGFDIQNYMEHNINMAFGKPTRITFQANDYAIPSIIDTFGKNVIFSNQKDGKVECVVNVPKYDMLRWALQNCDQVTITSPVELISDIKECLRHALDIYVAQQS